MNYALRGVDGKGLLGHFWSFSGTAEAQKSGIPGGPGIPESAYGSGPDRYRCSVGAYVATSSSAGAEASGSTART